MDKINPPERVIDVRMDSVHNQEQVLQSLNITMGNEQAFIDEIRCYEIVFLHYHSGRRAQTVYTMLRMRGLENLVRINSSVMTDWYQASLTAEQ